MKPSTPDKRWNPPMTETAGNRITRVYTRVGDSGLTQLVGGHVVPKDHPRLAAYGTGDELQVAIGAARDTLANLQRDVGNSEPMVEVIGKQLAYIANLIFTLNGDLATRIEDRWDGMPRIEADMTALLEKWIDRHNEDLPPLKDFVLPGGHSTVTALHQCRVVCRRLEREVETLARVEPIGEPVRPFVNRLSDLFFVVARRLALVLRSHGWTESETIWRRDVSPPF